MKDQLVKNVADPEQVKKADQSEKFGRELEIDDMKFVLSSKQGRRLLWKYLSFCGVYQSSFRTSAEIYYLEGQRAVGLKLLGDIHEASPEAYMQMMKENKGESK